MEQKATKRTQRLVIVALLSAVSYISALVLHIPVGGILTYDPKNVIIMLAGFILGPLEATIAAVISSVLEMLTFSDTGIWGCIMNMLSGISFVLPSAILYKISKKTWVTVVGLFLGIISTTAIMMLWNYLIVPIYMAVPREQIMPLLVSLFLPFNVLKGVINSAVTMLLFIPLKPVLANSNLAPISPQETRTKTQMLILFALSIFVAGAGILCAILIF